VSQGLKEMMKYRGKHKLNVVNIGVKLFSRNRDSKSEGSVSKNIFMTIFVVSTGARRIGVADALHE
jgi:hypothetical protein